jgi:RNA polymerase sigma factor (sigma-70 family)
MLAIRMALAWARSYHLAHREDELRSRALRALTGALRTYDEAEGATLEAHVVRRVAGELIRATKASKRREAQEAFLDDLRERLEPAVEDGPEALARCTGADALVLGSPEDALLEAAREARRRRAIAALPPGMQRLYGLRYLEDKPWKEVSRVLGIPVRTLQDHDAKLRKRLKAALADED